MVRTSGAPMSARELGREVASGEDARRIMKIGTWCQGADETLFNLDVPILKQELDQFAAAGRPS